MKVRIDEQPKLVRDIHSKAISNTSTTELNQAKALKEAAERKLAKDAERDDRINQMSSQVADLAIKLDQVLSHLSDKK